MSLLLIILLPFLGAVLPPLAARAGRDGSTVAALVVSAASFTILLGHAPEVFGGEAPQAAWSWAPGLGLEVGVFLDGLGFLFAFLILAIGLLIILYARFYLSAKEPLGRFLSYLLMFQGSMLGIVLSDNLLLLVVFWELTSLTSFLLIGWKSGSAEARGGARMALAVTGGGGLALLAGVLLLGRAAGSFEITEILAAGEAVRASPLYAPAMLLVALGAFAKSAQFPLHFWLPHAMSAPTPVSAYLHSATMVKAGVFLLARLWPALAGTDLWFAVVAGTGLVTLLIGAAIALFKDDLKAILAYSTVSQLGLMVMLLGLGTREAAVAAVFHLINHAAFKAALFMSAGVVDHETGERDIRKLGGLARAMPLTAVIACLCAASMAGAPPLAGFLSKEMALAETIEAGRGAAVPVLATLAALLSAAYSARFAWGVFFGPRPSTLVKGHDPAKGMLAGPALLTLATVAVGLAPAAAGPLLDLAASAVVGDPALHVKLKLWHGWTPELGLSALALVAGAALAWRHRDVEALWRRLPVPDARTLFERCVAASVAGSRRITDALHDRSLRKYLGLLFGAAVVAVGAAAATGGVGGGNRTPTPAGLADAAAFVLLAGGTLGALALHRNRFLALMFVAAVGLVVSAAFLRFSAPDLALTQISVEVVTVVLLLLALNLLPKETPVERRGAGSLLSAAVSVAAGLIAAAAAYAVMTRDRPNISGWFLDNSYVGGGGKNVVNVILVDFRGFDTFGEIIVLGVAALAVFALLDSAGRGASGARLAAWTPDQTRSPERHPLMLVTITRVLMPLAAATALFILLRGHNLPGGGFIAGLVAAIALLMQYMASGYGWAAQRMKTDWHAFVGGGVLVAAATGLGSLVFGRPFLTSTFGYLDLPVIGEVELATAMLFDVGVFLTVVGAVMLALAQLSRVSHHAEPLPTPQEPMDVDPSRDDGSAGEAKP